VCQLNTSRTKGLGAGSKQGDFSGYAPLRADVRLAMPHPDSCTVSASGELESGGKVTVQIYKT
jgi:hypothetical protein